MPTLQVLLVVWGQLHGLAGELCVEVVQTIVVSYLRLEWRERLLLLQLEGQCRSDQHTSARLGLRGLPPQRAAQHRRAHSEARCVSFLNKSTRKYLKSEESYLS